MAYSEVLRFAAAAAAAAAAAEAAELQLLLAIFVKQVKEHPSLRWTAQLSIPRACKPCASHHPLQFGGSHKGGFQKEWFWRMFYRNETWTRLHSGVPPERKPERGYVRMFPRNENRNEGTFAKTTLFRNRPLFSQWLGKEVTIAEESLRFQIATLFLPALLQKLFWFWGGKVCRKFGGNLAGFFGPTKGRRKHFGTISEYFSWENSCLEKNISRQLRSADVPP